MRSYSPHTCPKGIALTWIHFAQMETRKRVWCLRCNECGSPVEPPGRPQALDAGTGKQVNVVKALPLVFHRSREGVDVSQEEMVLVPRPLPNFRNKQAIIFRWRQLEHRLIPVGARTSAARPRSGPRGVAQLVSC